MGRLSQKELLSEGFGSLLRKSIASAARGAAAVGGALKSASDAGVTAGVGDVVKGAKAGYEAEKGKQKTPETELDSTIEELGYIKLGTPRGKGDVKVIDVAELDYDGQGAKIEGKRYNRPLVLKWDKENKSYKTVRGPKGEERSVKPSSDKPKEEPVKPQVTSSTFKDNLKQFVANNMKGHEFMSKLAVTEFVRSLAKSTGNNTWVKNIPTKINQVKSDNRVFSNKELLNLINLLKMDGILQESQKDLLRQLTLLCD